MARKPIAAKKGTPKGGGGTTVILFLALLAASILMLVSMASLVLVVFGLLPSIVAFLVDRSAQRFAFFSVFAMNFAGVFPHLLDLWMGSNSMSVAIDALTDVFALFTMYSSAALGWVLFAVTPPIVTTVMTFIAQRRISILRGIQKKLIAEWGDDVTRPDPENEAGDEKTEPGAPPKEPGAAKAKKKKR